MFIRKIPKPVFIIVGVVVGLAVIGKLARSNNPELLLTKGQEHLNSGEYNKALRFCQKVTRKKPDQIEAWNCKAESALFVGNRRGKGCL